MKNSDIAKKLISLAKQCYRAREIGFICDAYTEASRQTGNDAYVGIIRLSTLHQPSMQPMRVSGAVFNSVIRVANFYSISHQELLRVVRSSIANMPLDEVVPHLRRRPDFAELVAGIKDLCR